MKKKIISNVIVGLLVAGVVSAIGVGAATLFASSDVVYDNTNSGASATTVKEALDELYQKVPEYYNPYAVGTPIYYNPVSGSKCFDYVSDNSLNENKTGCMKWYIIGEDTDTIDMILDHNTTHAVNWNNYLLDSPGPDTAISILNDDTSGWSGVLTRSDTYTDPAQGYTENYTGKARLIEANEIAQITGADKDLSWDSATVESTGWFYLDGKYGTATNWKTQVAKTQGASKYAWLFDHTWACTDYGCNMELSGTYGYWTSSAVAGSSNLAWAVHYTGGMSYDIAEYSDLDLGLRPVITIPKP